MVRGKKTFSISADHEQDWQPYPVDPYFAICDGHTLYGLMPRVFGKYIYPVPRICVFQTQIESGRLFPSYKICEEHKDYRTTATMEADTHLTGSIYVVNGGDTTINKYEVKYLLEYVIFGTTQ